MSLHVCFPRTDLQRAATIPCTITQLINYIRFNTLTVQVHCNKVTLANTKLQKLTHRGQVHKKPSKG